MSEIEEKKELRRAFCSAILLVVLMWVVQVVNVAFSLRLQRYGLSPHELHGLLGILTMPFLHEGWGHLLTNTAPMWILSFGLFLFYHQKGWILLLYLYLISGLFTWCIGRVPSIHIGASGLIYALAAFHFVTGLMKKEVRQMAFALLVAFLYGGFVWAFFPTLFKNTSISWEGHLSGLLAGIVIAVYARSWGPQPPPDPFLDEVDEEDGDEEEAYWQIPDENTDLKPDSPDKP